MAKNTERLGAAMSPRARGAQKNGFAGAFADKPVVPTVRLAIDLEQDFHRKLKMTAIERGMTQRELVLAALKKTYPELRG